MKKYVHYVLMLVAFVLFMGGKQLTVQAANDSPESVQGQLAVGAYVVEDQNAALLTVQGETQNRTIERVIFSVWHDGVSDMRDYSAAKLDDGRWIAFVPISDYKKTGSYYGQASVRYVDGQSQTLGLCTFHVENNWASGIYIDNENEKNGTFDIVVTGITAKSGVYKVDVPVWSSQDQSDIAWYSAQRQGDGTFVVHVNIKNHKYHYGSYQTQVYITSNNGVSSFVGNCRTTLKMPSVKLDTGKASDTDVILATSDVPYASSIRMVKYGVWNKGLSDLKWYQAVQQNDGRWLGFMSSSVYGYGGTFWADAYAVLDNGQEICLGRLSYELPDCEVSGIVATNKNSADGTFDVVIGGVSAVGGVRKVQVAAWTASDLSDLHYYDAFCVNGSTYLMQVDVSNHAYHYGGYGLSVYITNGYGTTSNAKSQCVSINAPNTVLMASTTNDEADCVLHLSNPMSQKHIKRIEFSVWNQGVSDIRGYALSGGGNDYMMVISMTDFNKMGTFYVQAKAHMDNGSVLDMGLTSFKISCVNGMYSIMGTSGSTVNQMMNYYMVNASFPSFYLDTNGISLREFCQIYYEECAVENVRVEVAFCQAMKETGFLRFTGRVPITAYNFAGMGAVDSDASAYATFSSVREGVRAQIQHLKAYASTEPLNNTCVDPRFNLVTRGSAVYTEWLGIHENPYGKGWATAQNYGYSLRNDYMANLFKY